MKKPKTPLVPTLRVGTSAHRSAVRCDPCNRCSILPHRLTANKNATHRRAVGGRSHAERGNEGLGSNSEIPRHDPPPENVVGDIMTILRGDCLS
jgi:hypothetical protein